jgi:hypothetical protein
MRIEVYRYAGDSRGADVVEPMLATLPALLARGRAELNTKAATFVETSVDVVPRVGLRVGQLVDVPNLTGGGAWRGKIVGVSVSADAAGNLDYSLNVERPL